MTKKGGKALWMVLAVLVIVWAGPCAAAAAAEKVQYGGTLTYTDVYPQFNPMSWDSIDWNWKHGYDTGFYIEHLLMGDLQKGPRGAKLFEFKNSGAYIPYQAVRGELAERWEIKHDPLSIVFHLRKGVMWQDKPGIMKAREFVTADVVYAINYLKGSRKAIPGYMDFIDRIEAKDKYTVVFYLKEWNPEWGYYVGWGYYDAIQAPEQEKAPGGGGKWQNACGTGPFMLEDYKDGHSQIYQKNRNYWDSEMIGNKKYQLPFVDRVIMMLMKDSSTALTALRTGKIDLMLQVTRRNWLDVKKTNPEILWSKSPSTNATYIALRMDKKPFSDIRVRRALNMAIDKEAVIKTFDGGDAEMVNVPYSRTAKDVYTPLEKLSPAAKELFIYNPEKAKKLLAEAGYPNGFTFKLTYGGSDVDLIDTSSMIAAQLAKVGVKMEIELIDYPSGLSKQTKKTFADAIWVSTDHATPMVMIRKSYVAGQLWNVNMMSDPYVEKTYKRLASNTKITPKQMNDELKKLGVYILEQAPGIPMQGSYWYTGWWPWVKNYYGELRAGSHRMAPIIARIWIDQELKKKMGY